MKNILFLFILLFISAGTAQTQFVPNFYIGNVVSSSFNYNSGWIPNSKEDKTIKHSIIVTAEGGGISATFIMYFGDNTYEAEAKPSIPDVYTIKSWHHISEYERICALLSDDSRVGIGFQNRIDDFPNRIEITKY